MGLGSETYYVILLSKNQPDQTLPEDLVRAHVGHLKQLEDRGQLFLCGPFSDYPGGMVVVQAESLAAAREIAEADPFVAAGTHRYELRTLHRSSRENNHMGLG